MELGKHGNENLMVHETRPRHAFFNGETGSGKSKLIEHLFWERMCKQKGGCIIDPVGDLAEAIMARIAATKDVSPVHQRKVIYLEPSTEMTFKFDPFDTAYTGKVYDAWFPAKCESINRVFARKEGVENYREMPRRERVMVDVLEFVGRNQKDGTHFGLHQAMDSLNVHTKKWDKMFEHASKVMPDYIVDDWLLMKRMNQNQFLQFTESTVNWLRQFLSPVVRAIFTGNVPSIDFQKIIAENGVILCNLRPNAFFSRDQSNGIAGLIVNEVREAAERNFYDS